ADSAGGANVIIEGGAVADGRSLIHQNALPDFDAAVVAHGGCVGCAANADGPSVRTQVEVVFAESDQVVHIGLFTLGHPLRLHQVHGRDKSSPRGLNVGAMSVFGQ